MTGEGQGPLREEELEDGGHKQEDSRHASGTRDRREEGTAKESKDIDGGWAWMVCGSCFFANFIVDGVIFSFGVLLLKLLDDFEETRSKTAWVGSTLVGTCMFTGPVVSLLLEFCTCRQVMILGSLISSAGFLLSAFATNVETLIFTFGFLGGGGFGLAFLTAILAVGLHFNQKRALATGIATSGSGVGTFAVSYATERLLSIYGRQGTLLIMTGVVCNLLICGALVRPLVKQPSNILTYCCSRLFSKNREVSTEEPSEKVPLQDEQSLADSSAEQVIKGDNSSSTLQPVTLPSIGRLIAAEGHVRLSRSIEQVNTKNDPKDRRYQSDYHLHSSSAHSHREQPKTLQEIFCYPLRRQDIFYSGSLYNLPEYQKDPNMASFLKTMATSQPSQDDISYERCSLKKDVYTKKSSIWTAYRELFCDKLFLMLLVTMVCWTGMGTVVMFIPDLAVSRGVSSVNAALLVSVLGTTNILGRLLAGWLANHRHVDSVVVYAGAMMLCGLSSALLPFCSSFALFVVCSCVFGVCMGKTYSEI